MSIGKLKSALSGLSSFLKSPQGTVFKILASLCMIGLFFYFLDWNKTKELLLQSKVEWLIPTLLVVVLRNFISGWRFQILSSYVQRISLWVLTKHYFIASMFNLFLPTTIGGDGVRAVLAKEEGLAAKDSIVLILVERFLGFFSFILFSLVACFFVDIPTIWRLGIVGMGVAYSLLTVFVFTRGKKTTGIGPIDKLIGVLNELSQYKGIIVKVFLVSLIYQFVSIMMRYFIALALNIDIPFVAFLVFIPLINIVTLLPISFGGIGLREGAFIFFFVEICKCATKEEAILLSIGSFLALVATGLIGVALFFYDKVVRNVQYEFSKTSDNKESISQ